MTANELTVGVTRSDRTAFRESDDPGTARP
jgi:hypothetical protein